MIEEPIIKLHTIPSLVIYCGDEEFVRIIQTGWKDKYSVIIEDAHEIDSGHRFMSRNEIKDKYDILMERHF